MEISCFQKIAPNNHSIYIKGSNPSNTYMLFEIFRCVIIKKIFIFLWRYLYQCWKKLSSKSSREDMCRLPTSFLLNIQSRVKQEVDMPQIQKCVTGYSSPYWYFVPNIRKLVSVVPEKNVIEIFCDVYDNDSRRRIVIPICRLR